MNAETVKTHRKHKQKHHHKHKHKHHKQRHADERDERGESDLDGAQEKSIRVDQKDKDAAAAEKTKEKQRHSRSHKKVKKHRDDSTKKSKERSQDRKKKKKAKDKENGGDVPRGQENTLDLSTLTKEEVKAIRKVIKKDEAEMRAMDMRVSMLRNEIGALRQSSAECLGPGSDYSSGNSRCPRCRKELPAWHGALPFLDSSARCQACKYRVCKECRYLQPNGLFLCRLCVCYRQEKLLTGEWMDPVAGGVHSTDLIKLSLRDQKYYKEKRKREERKKAEQAKKLILDGLFGKRRRHHHKRKRSRAKTEKRDEENTSQRRPKHRHRTKGHQGSDEVQETFAPACGQNKGFANETQDGKEMSRVLYGEEDNEEEEYEQENSEVNGNELYGPEYWEYEMDPYEYNYDGYYFEGWGDGEEEGFEGEYDDGPSQPEKSGLDPEVCREDSDFYCSNAHFESQQFGLPLGFEANEKQNRFRQNYPGRGHIGHGARPRVFDLPCLDYMSMCKPPPYQELCPYNSWSDPCRTVPDVDKHSTAAPAYEHVRRSKDRLKRKSLPFWKRFKLSWKETLRFVIPSLVRRNKNCSKKTFSDLDLDLDLDLENAPNRAANEDGAGGEKGGCDFEDINWNFQPKSGGHARGGGRIGTGRRGRIRGRRGMGRGRVPMGPRGMRARGRVGYPMPEQDGWGRKQSVSERRGSRNSKVDRKSRNSKGERNSRSSKSQKKKRKKSLTSGENGEETTDEIDKRSEKHIGTESSQALPSVPSLGKVQGTKVEKITEDVASQTSKPKRSVLAEFCCPFCRFNVEWA